MNSIKYKIFKIIIKSRTFKRLESFSIKEKNKIKNDLSLKFDDCETCEGSGFGNNIDGSCPSCMGRGNQSYQAMIDTL